MSQPWTGPADVSPPPATLSSSLIDYSLEKWQRRIGGHSWEQGRGDLGGTQQLGGPQKRGLSRETGDCIDIDYTAWGHIEQVSAKMFKNMDFFLFRCHSLLSPFYLPSSSIVFKCLANIYPMYQSPCQVFRTPRENMKLAFLKLNSLVGVEAIPHIPSWAVGQTSPGQGPQRLPDHTHTCNLGSM